MRLEGDAATAAVLWWWWWWWVSGWPIACFYVSIDDGLCAHTHMRVCVCVCLSVCLCAGCSQGCRSCRAARPPGLSTKRQKKKIQ
jgi:hypothetical protein